MSSALGKALSGSLSGLFDMRFASKDEEASFQRSLEPEVARVLGWCAAFGVVVSIFHKLHLLLQESQRVDDPLVSLADWRVGYCAYSAVCFDLQLLFFWTCLLFRERYAWIARGMSFASLEMHGVWVTTYIVLLINATLPTEAWGFRSVTEFEINTLLASEMTIMVVLLFAPMRSCVSWFLPMGSFIYAVMAMRRGVATNSISETTVFLLLVVVFAYIAAFQNDRRRRERWAAQAGLSTMCRKAREASPISTEKWDGWEAVATQTVAVPYTNIGVVLQSLCDTILSISFDLSVLSVDSAQDHSFWQAMTGLPLPSFFHSASGRWLQKFLQASERGYPQNVQRARVAIAAPSGAFAADVIAVCTGLPAPRYLLGIRAADGEGASLDAVAAEAVVRVTEKQTEEDDGNVVAALSLVKRLAEMPDALLLTTALREKEELTADLISYPAACDELDEKIQNGLVEIVQEEKETMEAVLQCATMLKPHPDSEAPASSIGTVHVVTENHAAEDDGNVLAAPSTVERLSELPDELSLTTALRQKVELTDDLISYSPAYDKPDEVIQTRLDEIVQEVKERRGTETQRATMFNRQVESEIPPSPRGAVDVLDAAGGEEAVPVARNEVSTVVFAQVLDDACAADCATYEDVSQAVGADDASDLSSQRKGRKRKSGWSRQRRSRYWASVREATPERWCDDFASAIN